MIAISNKKIKLLGVGTGGIATIGYSPDFTNKSGKRYRYYISQNLIQYRDHPKGTMARIPAHEIEKVILKTIEEKTIEVLALDPANDHAVIEHINKHTLNTENIIQTCINKITVHPEELQFDINTNRLHQTIQKHLNLNIPERYAKLSHTLSVPFTTRRSYKGAIIIKAETSNYDPFDLPQHQLRNLIRGIIKFLTLMFQF